MIKALWRMNISAVKYDWEMTPPHCSACEPAEQSRGHKRVFTGLCTNGQLPKRHFFPFGHIFLTASQWALAKIKVWFESGRPLWGNSARAIARSEGVKAAWRGSPINGSDRFSILNTVRVFETCVHNFYNQETGKMFLVWTEKSSCFFPRPVAASSLFILSLSVMQPTDASHQRFIIYDGDMLFSLLLCVFLDLVSSHKSGSFWMLEATNDNNSPRPLLSAEVLQMTFSTCISELSPESSLTASSVRNETFASKK